MKTLQQLIDERNRKSKTKRSKRLKKALALMEVNRFMEELDKEFPYTQETRWPSTAELNESSRKMFEMVEKFRKGLERSYNLQQSHKGAQVH